MSLIARSTKALASAAGASEEPRQIPSGGAPGELNAVLGRGSTFEGKLVFEGTVHINGAFTGEVRSKDVLVIGEGAQVQGEIDVGTLIVNGEVSGTLRARHVVELHAPARVHGTIITPSLVIDRGVIFEGTSRMENLEALDQPAPAAPGKARG